MIIVPKRFDDRRTIGIAMLDSTFEPPARDELELTAVLHALSDPMRLAIVAQLAADAAPRACGSFGLPVAKSTSSHHFRVLREAGVITQLMDGRQKMTTLRREDLDARFPGLLASVLSATPAGVPISA
jgi:DNA-binding transcriptional ArsR family regulator